MATLTFDGSSVGLTWDQVKEIPLTYDMIRDQRMTWDDVKYGFKKNIIKTTSVGQKLMVRIGHRDIGPEHNSNLIHLEYDPAVLELLSTVQQLNYGVPVTSDTPRLVSNQPGKLVIQYNLSDAHLRTGLSTLFYFRALAVTDTGIRLY